MDFYYYLYILKKGHEMKKRNLVSIAAQTVLCLKESALFVEQLGPHVKRLNDPELTKLYEAEVDRFELRSDQLLEMTGKKNVDSNN